jgi:hypothetical protein
MLVGAGNEKHYRRMDPQLIALILASLNQKGQLDSSDYNRLFDPMIGILSGTYNQDPRQNIAFLEYKHKPTWAQVNQFYAPDSDEAAIAKSIEAGTPAMIVKQEILEQLALDPNRSQKDSQDLIALAEKLESEQRAFEMASMTAQMDNPLAKAGFSDPNARYNAEELYQPQMAELFARMDKQTQANPYKSKGQMPSSAQPASAYSPKITKANAPEDYVKIAEKNVGEKGNELINAEKALEKFIDENPDTYDLEYQSLLEARDNARQRYSENVVDAVGFTGAPNTKNFKTSDMLESLAKNQVKEETKTTTKPKYAKGSTRPMSTVPFDEAKAKLAGNTPESLALRKQGAAEYFQTKANTSGRTPFLDEIIQRALMLKLSGG